MPEIVTGLIVEGKVNGQRVLRPAPKLGYPGIELSMEGAGSPWLEIHPVDGDTVSMQVTTMKHSSKWGSKHGIFYREISKNRGGNEIKFSNDGNNYMRVRRIIGYLPEDSNS